jgi:pyruvate/2-oxoglutarate dehydrogenase complex dihydrolipoamide acyltransferase (E2) component
MYGFDIVSGGHNIFALLEFDITELRSELREARRQGRAGSLLAFMLKAIGKCLELYPQFNAMINYRVTSSFEQVDISIPIEVELDGVRMTKQYIIRDINAKSLKAVSEEIELSKANADEQQGFIVSPILRRIMLVLPRWLVVIVLKSVLRRHALIKKLSGTAFVTSVSMFSNMPGFILPYVGGPKACSFAIGSSLKKPVARGGVICLREMINVTAVFNHDLIDGAPAARFINELRALIETRYKELLS